jgi:hypothetical protein
MNSESQEPTRIDPAGKSPPAMPVGISKATIRLTEDDIFRDPFADFAPSGR